MNFIGHSLVVCILSSVVLAGCTPNLPHWVRPPAEVPPGKPLTSAIIPSERIPGSPQNLHVIEYDEQGDRWDRMQAVRTTSAIRMDPGIGPVIVYIHGWRHNADDRNDNLEGFSRYISSVRFDGQKAFGIYIGWRGASVKEWDSLEALTFPAVVASYPGREKAADRVAGLTLASDLWEIRRAANNRPLVIVGHSLGGRIAERMIGPSLVSYYALLRQHTSGVSRPSTANTPVANPENLESTVPARTPKRSEERAFLLADLVVLVNPASDSLRARQLKLALYGWPPDVPPNIISIVSKSDFVVKSAMPLPSRFRTAIAPIVAPPRRTYRLGHHENTGSERKETQDSYLTRAAGFDGRQVWGTVSRAPDGEFHFRRAEKSSEDDIGIPHNAYLTLNVDNSILEGHGGRDTENGIFNNAMSDLVTSIAKDCLNRGSFRKSSLYGEIHKESPTSE